MKARSDSQAGADVQTLEAEETQASQAYRILEEMIVTLEISPGTRISENSISKRLGIGRTPVREAMQRLAREGTLRILPRAGAIVSDIDVTDQFKLIEVRRGLERVIAGRAARLADAETKAIFDDLAARFDQAAGENDYTVFIAADREFNQMMVRTANNSYATAAMAPIQAQTRRFWFLNFKKFGDLQRVSLLHARIARAIAANDAEAARKASDDLIDYVEEYTRKTLEALL
jgi:DNA-binding GntR family transcriptional regulator